jgi:hypothetical protein
MAGGWKVLLKRRGECIQFPRQKDKCAFVVEKRGENAQFLLTCGADGDTLLKTYI